MQGKAVAKPTAPASKPVTAKVVKTKPAKPMVAQAVPVPTAKVIQATPATMPSAKPVMAKVVKPEPVNATSDANETLSDAAPLDPQGDEDSTPLVRTARPVSKFNWLRFALILLATGFAICIAVGIAGTAFILMKGTDPGGGGGGIAPTADDVVHIGNLRDAKGVSEKVYRLVLNKREWSVDNGVLAGLGAHTAWKNNDCDFWFAIVVKDHTVYKPRDADSLRFAIDKLESHFGGALELGARAEPTKFNGLPAQKIQFKGQINTSNWLGECYMFFKDGIAYHLFLASPDWALVEKFAAAMPEKHFSVQIERRAWRAQPIPMDTVASLNGKFTVTVPKEAWQRAKPKDEDENGELFVIGKYLKEKDNRKNASLFIFTIPKKDDLQEAMKAGRDYLDLKIKNDMGLFRIVHAGEVSEGQPETGTDAEVGNRRGRIADLKTMIDQEAKRYYLLAVVNDADQTYVVRCECTWESRQIWRQDFLEILRSLTFK